ncbi:ubiquinol-cytochrome C chaperone family protein [Polycladidibacter hongkongensis]|uniref:ubiquinol-cytochrome C chaperone family protein n=1 Tax=Polycladidibacter hongkongensis TaxID=1647556 RepID=UPI00082E6CEA|nr:ubiquinol-cytochrome C chaperone family protein [Pseudovibrio hongkongensis]
MLFNFLQRRRLKPVYAAYASVVEQARQPVFYLDYKVKDSAEGRFELIVLHCFCLLKRLDGNGAHAKHFSQALFDLFFEDMDQSMRELGIGDEGVRRRIRKMSESFYGHSLAYAEGLKAPDDTRLADALAKNVYADEALSGAFAKEASALAAYVRGVLKQLAGQEIKSLLKGEIVWPQPDAF